MLTEHLKDMFTKIIIIIITVEFDIVFVALLLLSLL